MISESRAIEMGTAHGIEAVMDVLNEQGVDAVRACQRPGHVGWDESAINAGVARIVGVPEELESAYYAAYAKAAHAKAEELSAT